MVKMHASFEVIKLRYFCHSDSANYEERDQHTENSGKLGIVNECDDESRAESGQVLDADGYLVRHSYSNHFHISKAAKYNFNCHAKPPSHKLHRHHVNIHVAKQVN